MCLLTHVSAPAVPGSSDPSSTVVELVERIEGLSVQNFLRVFLSFEEIR